MPSDHDIQPGVRIDKSLWEQFRNDVESRKGSVRGHLKVEVENALREYIHASEGGDTHDRLRRIENRIEDIDERLPPVPQSDEGKRKKESDVSATTRNRLIQVRDRIEREVDKGPVHEAVVRQAIEDVAGHSDPTIRRYREMLLEREDLYPHPRKPSKFVLGDKEFVEMVQALGKQRAITNDRYQQMVETFGGYETFREALIEFGLDEDDEARGFA